MDEHLTFVTGLVAVLLLTSFVKLATTLSILRIGIGLRGIGFGVVVLVVAAALTLVVTGDRIESAFSAPGSTGVEKLSHIETEFKPFLVTHTEPEIQEEIFALAKRVRAKGNPEQPDGLEGEGLFSVTVAAFLISELREAFELGLMFIIPFLVLDLVVANILMVLGVTQLPVALVAFPLKLLLFVAVDGWTLVVGRLLEGYA